LRGRFF